MSEKPRIIIGGGGHTAVLAGILRENGLPTKGIITADPDIVNEIINGVPVLCLEDDFRMSPAEVTLVNGVGNAASKGGPNMAARMGVYQRYRERGFDFEPLISNSAAMQPDVWVADGVQVMPGAVVQPRATLKENCIVNTHASVDHDVVIAPHVHVAPGAVLCGNVTVNEGTHVGAGAVIIQGVTIGSGVVIGAGAVIKRDVPDGAVVA